MGFFVVVVAVVVIVVVVLFVVGFFVVVVGFLVVVVGFFVVVVGFLVVVFGGFGFLVFLVFGVVALVVVGFGVVAGVRWDRPADVTEDHVTRPEGSGGGLAVVADAATACATADWFGSSLQHAPNINRSMHVLITRPFCW